MHVPFPHSRLPKERARVNQLVKYNNKGHAPLENRHVSQYTVQTRTPYPYHPPTSATHPLRQKKRQHTKTSVSPHTQHDKSSAQPSVPPYPTISRSRCLHLGKSGRESDGGLSGGRGDSHGYDVLVFRLADELGEYAEISEGALCVCYAHGAVHAEDNRL